MDLWSKGLGRLVLTMRLSERAGMRSEDGEMVMHGTMGKPTYWDWSVRIDETDVVDFLIFLKQPAPIRFMVQSEQRWLMLRAALGGAVLFALHTMRLLMFGPRRSSRVRAGEDSEVKG